MSNINTEQSRKLMNNLIEKMAILKYPVVFKGALVMQNLLDMHGISNTYRGTEDIDMDWGTTLENKTLVQNAIENVVKSLGIDGVYIEKTRDFGDKQSGGFNIVHQKNILFSLDVNLRENPFFAAYKTDNGINFNGASKEKMIADKILVISKQLVFRRSKDIYDLHLLGQLPNIRYNDIVYIINVSNKPLGEFKQFINNILELKHSYDKLRGIVNKPSFEESYTYVRDFISPFILGLEAYNNHITWISNERRWI